MKIALLIFATITFTTPAFANQCKIAQSVYRDTESKGFELVFGKSIQNGGTFRATAVIKHPLQQQVYSFNVTQANGYGSTYFQLIKPISNKLEDESFVINFFNQNFKSAALILGREEQAPKYIFITGLGSHDYYRRRGRSLKDSQNNPPFLLDLMWVYERCQ
jgi:hypothetical protein